MECQQCGTKEAAVHTTTAAATEEETWRCRECDALAVAAQIGAGYAAWRDLEPVVTEPEPGERDAPAT